MARNSGTLISTMARNSGTLISAVARNSGALISGRARKSGTLISARARNRGTQIAINSSTSVCLRSSSSSRTYVSIHFQPSQPTTIRMSFIVTLTLSSSTFYFETDQRKCEMTLGGWHCGLRLFKLGRPLHKGRVSSMTCMLHRQERYHLHHRGGECQGTQQRHTDQC